MKLKEDIVVYKGAWAEKGAKVTPVLVIMQLKKGTLVRLGIGAQAAQATKNRASQVAKVLSIESADGHKRYKKAYAHGNFTYTVGKPAKPDGWTSNLLEDCGHGIHFYLRRKEAMHWVNVRDNDPQGGGDKYTLLYEKADRLRAENYRKLITAEAKLEAAKRALA